MEKIWLIEKEQDKDLVNELSNALNQSPIIAELLIQRGISSFDEAKSFFRPNIEELHDPFLMKDMDVAVERLKTAVEKNERILIYGDYDVDGTCSVALASSFLEKLDADISCYIPDRYKEGYGVSKKGIEFARDQGIQVLITLDCGVKAYDSLQLAKEYGIDVIVCDHHEASVKLPPAVAVLDPMRKDCNYPFKGLCGCGVGFKLMQGLSIKIGLDQEELFEYLDILALAIAADIVPVVGENRILSYYGLTRLNSYRRPGIKAMFKDASFKRSEIAMTDLVFQLAPRINAAGRIESAMIALELLKSEDDEEAAKLSKRIDDLNQQRKELDRDTTEEALNAISSSPSNYGNYSTVVSGEDWHKGVIGIVASRIIEKHYKPTIVFTRQGDNYVGSARSIKGIDIHQALENCKEHIQQFGGHTMAAGLTISMEDLEAFSEKFEEEVEKLCKGQIPVPEIKVSAEVNLKDLDGKFYNVLKQFAPFGPGNMRPVFLSQNLIDTGQSRLVGSDKSHLRFQLQQDNRSIAGIGFGMGEQWLNSGKGKSYSVVYALEENEWNGKTSLQLQVKDFRRQ